MKQTQAIYMNFNAKPRTDVYLSVPFKVKRMKVKNISYDPEVSGTLNYVVIESSLGFGSNSPLGTVLQDITYGSSSSNPDISIEFQNPLQIQGSYTFTLKGLNGLSSETSNAGAGSDFVVVIIEFSDE